jgi:hypothetical protein
MEAINKFSLKIINPSFHLLFDLEQQIDILAQRNGQDINDTLRTVCGDDSLTHLTSS